MLPDPPSCEHARVPMNPLMTVLPTRRIARHRLCGLVLGLVLALVPLVVVGTLVGAAWFGWRAYDQLVRYPLRAGSGSSAVVSLEVPRGSSFPQVLAQLVEAGVVPADEAVWTSLGRPPKVPTLYVFDRDGGLVRTFDRQVEAPPTVDALLGVLPGAS